MPWVSPSVDDSLDWLGVVADVPLFDASQSQVSVSPSMIPADGNTTATVTVTIVTGYGDPIVGATVSFTATGTNVTLTTGGTTDANGTTTATVKSPTVQTITVSASYAERPIGTTTITTTDATVSASQSTVTPNPASIQANGIEAAVITVVAKNVAGIGLPGLVPTAQFTGAGTLSAFSVSDANGQSSASFTTSDATTHVFTVTVGGIQLAQAASVTGTGAGSAASVTAVSRDYTSSTGGETLTLTGTGFVATPVVTFGGTVATNVNVISGTSLSCVAPAHAIGIVDIAVANQTLVGAFEYLPAATTTFAKHDFEDGLLTGTGTIGFTSSAFGGGTVATSTDVAHTGTRSCKCSKPSTTDQNANLRCRFTNNRMAIEANGVWVRCWVYVPSATVTDMLQTVAGHDCQIKIHLCRPTAGGQPGWLMWGIGKAFTNASAPKFFVDNGLKNISGGNPTTPNLGDGVWREYLWQMVRSGGTGSTRCWEDGRHKFDRSDTVMGQDSTTVAYQVDLGIVFLQHGTITELVYLDDVYVANGVL